MEIEIWSDIMCPFCYIGKRKLERSLKEINPKDIKIIWRSYQLNPDMITDENLNISSYLSQHKGISLEQAQQLNRQVASMAKEEGLNFNLDNAKVANSMKAHILLHFAKQFDKQNEAKELLFRAYFIEGKNIDDIQVLNGILDQLSLDKDAFQQELVKGELEDEVKMDIHEAKQLGVRGVPFFVYNRKYGISGAQPQDLFNKTLFESYEDWVKHNTGNLKIKGEEGQSCGLDGCE